MIKITIPILAGLLLSSMAANPVHSATSPDSVTQNTTGFKPPDTTDTTDIRAYRDVVARIESDYGAYSAELPESLLSLGIALQALGRHDEALGVFKRGTHLARISSGLYSASQIPMIQGEISSHIAKGELLEADERQQYMHKVQQRSLSSPESRTQALMQQAQWQYDAYQMGIGEQRYGRLLNMWDLYRGALTGIAQQEGETSANLLSPLRGLLQTQYLISGYKEASSSGFQSESADTFAARQQANRFNAYRSRSYKQGNAVIRAIYDVEKAQTEEQFLAAAESLVMLGDWMLWNGAQDSAQEAYQEALQELVELDDAQLQMERLFGKPLALPVIEGVDALPSLVTPEEGDILVQFDVSETGRVVNLERLSMNGVSKGVANRLMRRLRATTFRPRFVDMQPVSTENITYAYKISD